jgi:hypothetical protein
VCTKLGFLDVNDPHLIIILVDQADRIGANPLVNT